jgi:PhoH-like ATPase
MGSKKKHIPDTNVILHDYQCLKHFRENDIFLPIATLKELDNFKKGSKRLNFNARKFIREPDCPTTGKLPQKALPVGEEKGMPCIIRRNVLSKSRLIFFMDSGPGAGIACQTA